MSLPDEINVAIQKEIESLGDAIALSPTSVALAVQQHFAMYGIEPHIKYSSLEHLKQMARAVLGRRYEAEGEESVAHQGDMFSGQLQDRYPVPRARGVEPIYKKRDSLSPEEVHWNVCTLRKSAAARLEHADALQAWADGRRVAA